MTEELPANLAPNAFAGTAEDYARYRPAYPAALIQQVLSVTPGRDSVVDLACGPGRVALACAEWFDQVLAVDIEVEMLEVGRRLADERGVENTAWRCTRAEDLKLPPSSVDLITIGEAFHRLDQRRVLESAAAWLKPGGVLATMGGATILRPSHGWYAKVFEVVEAWTRDAFPNGWAAARPGSATQPAALRGLFESYGFIDIAAYEFTEQHTWTVDSAIGYLRSMSVCSPAVLGARRGAFESAVRQALLELNPDGLFDDAVEFGLTVMRRPA